MKISVELSDDQTTRFQKWKASIDHIKLETQRVSMSPEEFQVKTSGGKYPYTGDIGGLVIWYITQTAIGTVVKCSYWGENLDLTDYDLW